MKKIELLAPAKNLETAIAAINSGADAIYIGANNFGARVNASNPLADIEKLVNYAHKFYVKVHVTINTILNNDELNSAIELVKKLYNIGVDAIIVQDMGLIKASIDGKIPPIQIHASTQCDNRTLEKVKFFNDIGVSRVILARELSTEKISEICKNVDCEIETFVHGALCVSYSGQCYMSYANGGRSANRGECAQPCRKKYSLVDEDGKYYAKNKYLLSLKDFNASKSIEKLINAGVKSFKIEGRLKDKNYVKNVTAYYNELINKYACRTSSGKVFLDFEPNVQKTFNRGYTDYFLNGRSECYNFMSPKSIGIHVGVVKAVGKDYFETDAVLNPQDGICYFKEDKLLGFLVNKVVENRVYPNNLSGIYTGAKLYRNFDSEFEKVLNSSKTVRKIGVNLKLYNDKITAEDEDKNMVSLVLPNGESAKNPSKVLQTFENQLSKMGDSYYYLMSLEIKAQTLPFLKVSIINEIRRELLQKLTSERLRNYKRLPQKPICYSPFPQKELYYNSNIYNKEAKVFYESCGCKIEQMALESSKNISQGTILMTSKHCLKYAFGLCSKTSRFNKNLYLEDETGKKYPLDFNCSKCEMQVLNF